MSIQTSRDAYGVHIVVTNDVLPEFITMVRRAMNCWPDASPELKKFADRLEHGGPLQDYDAQAGGKSRPEQ